MGFFKDMWRKAQCLPTESEIAQSLRELRTQIDRMKAQADDFDAVNANNDNEYFKGDMKLGAALRFDMLNYALHIAASDGVLEQPEVDAINSFLGVDLTYDECLVAINNLGLGGASFSRELPVTFQILSDISGYPAFGAKQFAENLIVVDRMLGTLISSIDGDATSQELADKAKYIKMLERYASTF